MGVTTGLVVVRKVTLKEEKGQRGGRGVRTMDPCEGLCEGRGFRKRIDSRNRGQRTKTPPLLIL